MFVFSLVFMVNGIEKKVKLKFEEIDKIIKNSFVFIREDVKEMQESIEAMRKYLKKKDKQYESAQKQDKKIQMEFRSDVDDFTQKIKELNIALDNVKEIEKTVVVKKELAQMEDRIRSDFRNVINEFREDLKEFNKRVDYLEKGKVKEKKKEQGEGVWRIFGKTKK